MKAFAPGSVTPLFAPATETAAGSLGVSFTIEDSEARSASGSRASPGDGVTAVVEPAAETVVIVNGEPHSFAPVEIALAGLDLTARVELTATIPIGYGFGASGAATLSTLLAANEKFGCEQSRDELLSLSFRSEREAGTGLGDVFIQEMGGLVWNMGDGPQRVAPTEEIEIEYTVFDRIPTPDLLSDEEQLERITDAARDCFAQLSLGPAAGQETMRDLLSNSWEFARRTGLPTDRLREAVEQVERAGGTASMAMIGDTVVATGIEDGEGVLENRTQISSEGARLL